jgi:2-oxoglutarate ferredoxin oxidoreductase subunit alpha
VSLTETRSQINDFAIKLANVNGTGSASANGLLMQAIFRMGIPVSGKNLFPSNIQGLPTWYEIRVNKDGHIARSQTYDLMVAMNQATYAQDVAEVRPGGYLLFDSSGMDDLSSRRDDITVLGVPLAQICLDNFAKPRERVLMANVVYAGVICALIGIDTDVAKQLLAETFAKNEALRESNQRALMIGVDYATEHFACPLPFHLAPMAENDHSILIDGNTAVALGCLYAGATVVGWYPITPATGVMDNFISLCKKYRRELVTPATDNSPAVYQNNYCIVQAEDEIAAIGVVLGANWSGARSFTSTSGPGISLMNELLGLAYYTEIPAVVVDVQRVGPSTGMPTRTQQSDLLAAAFASHGDTEHIVLLPADPKEAFEFAVASFDLAEQFQTPVLLLSDLDIGMNDWVVPEFEWSDAYQWNRGRVLTDDDLAGMKEFFRYNDEDDHHVAARTIPGSDEKGAYFIRGSGHDRFGLYTEEPAKYQQVLDRLKAKVKSSSLVSPQPVVRTMDGASIGMISIGSCDRAMREAQDLLAEAGVATDYMRIRAFPFPESVRSFVESHDKVFVVEQNRDAQLRTLITVDTGVAIEKMTPALHYSGFPLSANQVVADVLNGMEQ